MKLVTMLQWAGVLHAGLLCAGIMMPRVVEMKSHVAQLPQFLRDLFWTYYIFIGGCIVGFGSVTFFFAHELASGEALGRAVAGFLAAFWTLRLVVAGFVFKMEPYLTSKWFRVGYAVVNAAFVFLIIVYALAAFGVGGRN
ncbi:MAG: hypothetical protein ACXW3Z_15305 [Limisphaerales bacterium]